jgi:hypothetical protein
VTPFGTLATALKATALVVMLSFAWAMPATAHSGHGAASRPDAKAAIADRQVKKGSDAANMDRSPQTAACEQAANGVSGSAGIPTDDSAQGRSCCGTMCVVALIEHRVAPLSLRTPNGIRRDTPPASLAPAGAPGPDARPPRTIDIA